MGDPRRAGVPRRATRAASWLVALWLALLAPAALAQVAVPTLTAHVTDLTGTLSAADVARLEARLVALEKRKGSQFVILMVPTTQPEAIEEFALKVAETNRIGRTKVDDGLLLLVAKDDRKARIEVGYGLEGVVTDALASRVIREYLAPKFRENNYAGGLDEASAVLEKLIDGEPLPAPMAAPAEEGGDPSWIFATFMGFFAGTFAASTRLRPVPLRRIGAGALAAGGTALLFGVGASLLLAAVVAFLIAGAKAGGRILGPSAGSWGGGGGGGWSGGGGGGGGFSGGGGGFGGGGASGGW